MYVTEIPTTIWRNSSFNDLTYSFKSMPTFSYPPIQELVYSLLLAEARPPVDEPESYRFDVRLQKLLSYGAVDPAIALSRGRRQSQTVWFPYFLIFRYCRIIICLPAILFLRKGKTENYKVN